MMLLLAAVILGTCKGLTSNVNEHGVGYSLATWPIKAAKYMATEDPDFDRMYGEVSPFIRGISPLTTRNSPLYEVAEDPEFERIYREALTHFPFLNRECNTERSVTGNSELYGREGGNDDKPIVVWKDGEIVDII